MIPGGCILIVFGIILTLVGVGLNRSWLAQLVSIVNTGSINPGNILIVIGVLMLIGGIVLLVVGIQKSNERKAQQFAAPTAPAAPSYAPPTAPSYAPPKAPSYVPPTAPAPVAPASHAAPAPAAADNRFRLQCLLGAFAGKRFPINGTVRIGRDRGKCNLVFPQTTSGISGIHCELTVQGDKVLLKDLGSTYGTFVEGGRRLAANETVRLQIGSKFWLGSENQVFVIAPKGGL